MGDIEYTQVYSPSAPANTPASAPLDTAIDLGQIMLWRLEVRIPPGHAGYTGLALVDSGQYVIPWSDSGPSWFIGDDDLLEYPYAKQVGASAALYYYNTSADYAHGWQVRLIYTPQSLVGTGDQVIVTPDLAEAVGVGWGVE